MKPLLSVEHVSKQFHVGDHTVQALDDVNFKLYTGECLAVVGESGSGKSTIANIILGIHPATAGVLLFEGEELTTQRSQHERQAIQLVQQNPLSALNPGRSIGASLRLPLDVYKLGKRAERNSRVEALLEEVGLPAEYRHRAPAALSGGQRQRVAIARALACESQLLVLDEPTSALDVLVQTRVLRLLNDLRQKRRLTYLFITHDLSVVRNVADRVAVFEKGKLVELNTTEAIFTTPGHPYTKTLISAVPVVSADEATFRDQLVESAS
jgi:ABC-type glutathione transport system ATPase component